MEIQPSKFRKGSETLQILSLQVNIMFYFYIMKPPIAINFTAIFKM